MAIMIAQPHTWTMLGTGPLRIFPKSWRLGLIISATPPAIDDPPDEILQPNIGLDYNVMLPIYVKPLEGLVAAIGVFSIAPISRSNSNASGSSNVDFGTGNVLVPANLIPPGISGLSTVGSILTVDLGIWTNSPTSYMYQILRDGAPIAGAGGIVSTPSIAYTVESVDSGVALTVSSAATNDYGVGGPITSAGLTID